VFARCGKWLVIAMLVLTTGAHWAVLQTVAWTTMLAANLTASSFSQAVSDTFDGEHPCPLCKKLAAAKKAGKKSEDAAPGLKMEYPPAAESIVLFAPASFQLLPLRNAFADSVSFKPPLPPPRGCFA
jgi:hypothetical protein